MRSINDYNREANTITVAQYGSAGYVNWVDERFWANDVCYSVFLRKERIIVSFIMYFCKTRNYFTT